MHFQLYFNERTQSILSEHLIRTEKIDVLFSFCNYFGTLHKILLHIVLVENYTTFLELLVRMSLNGVHCINRGEIIKRYSFWWYIQGSPKKTRYCYVTPETNSFFDDTLKRNNCIALIYEVTLFLSWGLPCFIKFLKVKFEKYWWWFVHFLYSFVEMTAYDSFQLLYSQSIGLSLAQEISLQRIPFSQGRA